MGLKNKSVLVIGFNTRPLVYSLNRAGYHVYSVDFFGDIDLYPYVEDALILTKQLNSSYDLLKEGYAKFIPKLTFKLLEKYPTIDYYIIGSGLDDHFNERKLILNKIQNEKSSIYNLNNDFEVLQRARNLKYLYDFLKEFDYKVPLTYPLQHNEREITYPIILKKSKSSGGLNIIKIKSEEELALTLKILKSNEFNPSDWMFQEFIDGIPVSCTVISNGKESIVLSINRQIIGEKFVNSPKEFMYCGNIVPANLLEKDCTLIEEISLLLANKLNLKGINGFDYVLKEHYPYLMEINPRIPGSIRVSEDALNLNLMDLHVKSFNNKYWEEIKTIGRSLEFNNFSTKLIYFAPKLISREIVMKINALKFIHDKSDPESLIQKNTPVCSILYKDKTFSASYFGALKISNEIHQIISNG